MIRNLINLTDNPVTLDDMNGLVVDPHSSVDGLMFSESTLLNSKDLALHLLNNNLSLNDGVTTYYGMSAVNFLKGIGTQFTRDGKPITTVSDRPKDYYRHFTGAGDDVVNNKIGEGPVIHLIAAAGQSASIDVKFIDDVYVRDGEIHYQNAGFDSHLSIEVLCPPNVPFPSPTKTGTLDLINGEWVPNLTNTGAYMTAPVEVRLFRFINKMHLVGSDVNIINSLEPFLLNYPYFLRCSMTADSTIDGELKAGITIGMFRKKTI